MSFYFDELIGSLNNIKEDLFDNSEKIYFRKNKFKIRCEIRDKTYITSAWEKGEPTIQILFFLKTEDKGIEEFIKKYKKSYKKPVIIIERGEIIFDNRIYDFEEFAISQNERELNYDVYCKITIPHSKIETVEKLQKVLQGRKLIECEIEKQEFNRFDIMDI